MIPNPARVTLAVGAVALLAALLVGASPESAPFLSPPDIQRTEAGNSPHMGSRVTVSAVVTAVSPHGLFYFVSDPGGGEWSGLKVEGAALRRTVGERVSITGEVVEFFGETRLSEWSARGLGHGPLPEPSPVGVADLLADGERWEGVLVRVDDVLVLGETSRFDEYPIQDGTGAGALVHGEFHTWYISDPGDRFESITGVVSYGWGDFLLEPRSNADYVGWTSGRDFDAEIRFTVVDGTGAAMPCKVTFFPIDGSSLHLGPDDRAEGSGDVAYLPQGHGAVRLPSGTYDLAISRGIEYGLHEERIVVAPGGSPQVTATLVREVDSSGWLSGDFHLHCAPSSDTPVPVPGRILTLAGEGVEWAIATDHNVVTDYAPVIAELGLESWITSSIGQEITTRIFGHFNAWPLEAGRQPIPWENVTPAGLFATAHADPGPDIVQVNHPVIIDWGNQYFQIYEVSPFTGEPDNPGFSFDFDAVELMSGRYLDQGLTNFQTWMRMLNNGHRITATGNSDSHHVVYTEPGYPRNYVAASAEPDAVREEDLVNAVLDGQVFVSYGPILDFTANGVGPGGLATAPDGTVTLSCRVQCASWVRATEATLWANAEPISTVPLPAGLEGPQDVTFVTEHRPERDTWYVLFVDGEGDLAPVRRGPDFRPLAFTNPVRVDVDGNHVFDPPGNFADAVAVEEAREVDANGVGTRLGEWLAVEGCATTDTQFGDPAVGVFYLQDATGGVRVLEEIGPVTDVKRGDVVRAAGILSQSLGEIALADAIVEVATTGVPCPEPQNVTTGEVGWSTEALEGSVVRVAGVSIVAGSPPLPQDGSQQRETTIDDGSGPVTLVLPRGVAIPPEAAGLTDFGLTALVTQRDFSPPFQSSYRLTLRDAGDLEGLPPGAVSAGVTGAGVVFGRPRPNPFRTRLHVPVFPRRGEPLPGVAIHDVGGRAVRRLHATSSETHEIVWDGRDESGRVVGSGVYFLRTLGGREERTIRVVKMR